MNYPESEEQKTVIEWCRWNKYPFDRIYAIENERKANPQQSSRRKAMGVRSGVSDLFLPIARQGHHGLYIEMKSKKGTVSKSQEQFIKEVLSEGYIACVCYSADDAIRVLQDYCK